MFTGLPALSYEQQQQAVERIQQLMAEGMSSGEAIGMVAAEIRENHTGGHVAVMFDEDEEDYMGDNNHDEEQPEEE
ncbi:YoaH family protein [Erwinia amylovora]|uniref:UPF0181 protein BN437_2067 n=3 Tax=Erwinia amylovora TaxID=552 RepID=A0A831A1Y8_ERWAM|nr:YoaH family protein [Erwinia amylovora]CCP03432.1 UPF0181 protein [Erwinia amylovora Ea644]CCP07455.1 UPF0181 protein [Erwinia amylovora MR1]CDK15474.1 UPF0181 protein [Erwinia amylovora LA635]CDK18841.1 UPF0181 protein [Erwinia amylovora LA636]CDK22211.1 UPF0181 protein [Erwinia amylovora LA637]